MKKNLKRYLMKRKTSVFIATVISVFLILGYNNCLDINLARKIKGIEVGNPFSPSMKIVSSVCDRIMKAHPELSADQCQEGVLTTSFSESLGVPPQTLNPYWNLARAEQAGAVKADGNSLDPCL